MATKEDGENASQEGDQRIVDLPLQAVYKGTGKGKWGFGKGQTAQGDTLGGENAAKTTPLTQTSVLVDDAMEKITNAEHNASDKEVQSSFLLETQNPTKTANLRPLMSKL